jgi:DNA-binding transcriptional LysR family regulator
VRVSVSPILAQAVIVPSLNALYTRHPQLHVEIAADDRMVDMAREGVDVAIRTGTPNSDTVVARQIGELTRALYAAPSYIDKFGLPRHADELSQRHRLIANSATPSLNQWAMGSGKQRREFAAQGHTRTDNTAIVLALAQHGVGIARITDIVAQPLVRSGALVSVLPDEFVTPPMPIHAVMLQERHRLPKIRACIDHWAESMAAMADGPARAEHRAKR